METFIESSELHILLPDDALIVYRWRGCCGGARTIVYQDGRVVRKPEPEGILEDKHSQLSNTQMERLKSC